PELYEKDIVRLVREIIFRLLSIAGQTSASLWKELILTSHPGITFASLITFNKLASARMVNESNPASAKRCMVRCRIDDPRISMQESGIPARFSEQPAACTF